LFYDTLATDRGHEAYCNHFKCRIPFLNGGLFEPPGGYNWKKTGILNERQATRAGAAGNSSQRPPRITGQADRA